ncbi:MAG TPA: diaminopimelate epimerase [Pyrinomonadaceae bacterium]|jgi:diaminopimelate epimerase
MPVRFLKLHGYGNDYIVVEAGAHAPTGWRGGFSKFDEAEPFPAFVRRICDRHFGAGADGVAMLEPVPDDHSADFVLRIFNPDGSEAAMSGNGSRSAAAYLFHEGRWTTPVLRLSTRAGVKRYQLLAQDGRGRYRFAAEIGAPRFASAEIPLLTDEPLARVVNHPLDIGGGEIVHVTALEMCNPNACIFVADFEALDWRRLGRAIETHPRFPARTNVEFIRVLDRANIEVRVWERGVGPTLSSGTGACAAAVAACLNELTGRHLSVQMPGGRLEVEWRADNEVVLTGTAEVVYRGEWLQGRDEGVWDE